MPNADRLTGLDASFLALEKDGAHMHVGSVLVFEGPAPVYDDFVAHIERGLHLVPRYRQRLAFPPLGVARPVWVDDPHFNAAYHVRHTALPAPASEDQLRRLAGRVFSQQLDREKPLWEIWLVDDARRRPLRADLQDPPRAGRRDLGRGHHDRALRPRPRPAGARARARRGRRGRSRAAPSCSRPRSRERAGRAARLRALALSRTRRGGRRARAARPPGWRRWPPRGSRARRRGR